MEEMDTFNLNPPFPDESINQHPTLANRLTFPADYDDDDRPTDCPTDCCFY
jgi:hypothetical protein